MYEACHYSGERMLVPLKTDDSRGKTGVCVRCYSVTLCLIYNFRVST